MTKVNRGNLVQVLELVSPGLSQREVLEHSNSFCFQKKRVVTFDDETAASMDSPLHITGAVPAEPLKAILHKLKSDLLEFAQLDSKLIVKGKGESFAITMDKKIELPLENLESPTKWKALPPQFSEAVKLVESCASKDEASFALTCIHLAPKWIEAFDCFQFARFNIDMGLKKSTLVRQVSLKNVIDLDMNEFSETDHWIHFKNSSGLTLSCRRYDDKYPVKALNQIAKVTGTKIQLPKSLADIVERAEVFAEYSTQVEKYVHVSLKPNWVHIRGEGSYGWYKGRRKLSYTGAQMDFMIGPKMLTHLVRQHKECQVCTRKTKALKAQLGDFTFVASLVEPKKEDAETKVADNKD